MNTPLGLGSNSPAIGQPSGLGGQSAFSPLWGFDASVAVAEATAVSSSTSAVNPREIGVDSTAPLTDSLFMPESSMGMSGSSRLMMANTDLNPAANDFTPLYNRGRSTSQQQSSVNGMGSHSSSSFMSDLGGSMQNDAKGLLNNNSLLDGGRLVSPTHNPINGDGLLSGSRLATYSSQESKGVDALFKNDPVYRPQDPIGSSGVDSLFSHKTESSLYSSTSQDSLFSNGRESLFSKESTNVSSPEPWLFEGPLPNGLNGLDLSQ
jgi:hypothetical protein